MAATAKMLANPAVLKLRRAVYDIRLEVDSLTRDLVTLGESSDWQDERIEMLSRKIDRETARANRLAARARMMATQSVA